MANDFSWSACKALWRFESGALVSDSKGSNTLTNNGVTEDTANYKEGACAADFELGSSQYLQISDANLDAGFPLKSGDTTKKISISFWIKPKTITGTQRIICKYNNSTNKRSLTVGILGSKIWIGWGWGTSVANYYCDPTLIAGQWYHVGIAVDGIAKTMAFRVWDETAGIAYSNTGADSHELYVGDISLTIGTQDNLGSYYDGILDELVVFNEVLPISWFDEIRAGTFPPDPFAQVDQAGLTVIYDLEEYPEVRVSQVGIAVIYSLLSNAPDPCLSLTKCAAIALPVAPCLSLTMCEALSIPAIDPCLSLTHCPGLSKGCPDSVLSLTKCPAIPLSYGTGTFMIF